MQRGSARKAASQCRTASRRRWSPPLAGTTVSGTSAPVGAAFRGAGTYPAGVLTVPGANGIGADDQVVVAGDASDRLSAWKLANGDLLYEHLAKQAAGAWNREGRLGLVVGATRAHAGPVDPGLGVGQPASGAGPVLPGGLDEIDHHVLRVEAGRLERPGQRLERLLLDRHRPAGGPDDLRRAVDAIEGETAEAFQLPGYTVDSFWNRMTESKPAE